MKVTVDLPEVVEGEGLPAVWETGFEIQVQCTENTVLINANQAGLVSLARRLLLLASDVFPSGHHWHFDELNALEEGSCELVIAKG